jgi:hypothetical protein
MSTRRLPLDPRLPSEIEPKLRQSLTELFQSVSKRVNYATSMEVTNVTSNVTIAHEIVLCSAGTDTMAVTLLPASKFEDRTMRIKKIDSGAGPVLIVPQAGELIDGASTYTIASQYICLQVVSDGARWWIV